MTYFAAARFFAGRDFADAAGTAGAAFAALAFRAAVEHDLSFYDQFSSGRIVSRVNADTSTLGELVIIITHSRPWSS